MINLVVDGPFYKRILIIVSIMLHARRAQQPIHLYWKDLSGHKFDHYFRMQDDIIVKDWFPELQKSLTQQMPNLFVPNQTNQKKDKTEDCQLEYKVIPSYHENVLINQPNYLLGLPEITHIEFLRQEAEIYFKSDYEKLLSKFVRKFILKYEIIQQINQYESQHKLRVGIFLTIENKYFPIIDTIIKQIIEQYSNHDYQLFLSCNYHHFEEELIKKYPKLSNSSYKKNIKTTTIEKTLIDTYFYSTCHHLIMINFSYQPYLGWLISKDTTSLQIIKITEN